MACLYADAKCNLAVDLADENVMGPWKTDLNSLPEHVQFFWTTIYYKTGSRRGKQSLQSNGLEYHDLAWKLEDNASKYQGFEKYNANWRTVTHRLLRALTGLK